ncbi:MAG TPA: MauE/DoxX family redox-associated membrane protein [Acidimicrobiales bacterium]|nr:MauE/DoxX family redox-associated membrane protein [Acidimicrobiales bacterium]
MTALMLVLRLALAAMFVVAGVTKLRDRAGAQQSVAGVGVPAPLQTTVAFALSATELAVAALLVLPGFALIGASLAVALLTLFLVVLSVQYLRGRQVPCACFGQTAVTPAGVPTLVRNALLLGAAMFVILAR